MSNTAEATTLAAAGMGRPVNAYFCMPVAWTLKRARRKAPQMTKQKPPTSRRGSVSATPTYTAAILGPSQKTGGLPENRTPRQRHWKNPLNGPLCHLDNRVLQPIG